MMARANSTGPIRAAVKRAEDKSPPPLLVHETHRCYWLATGTREQLLSAGLCVLSHFPTGRKRIAYGNDGVRDWSLTAIRGGQWKLKVWRTKADEEEFVCLQAARRKAEGLPTSTETWRAEMLSAMEEEVRMICNLFEAGSSLAEVGFSFNDSAHSAILAQLSRLLTVARSAPITFNGDKRDATLTKLQARLGSDVVPSLKPQLRLVASNVRSSGSPAQLQCVAV